MRVGIVLVMIAMSLLAACGSAALPEVAEAEPQAVPPSPSQPFTSPVVERVEDGEKARVALPVVGGGGSPIATPVVEPPQEVAQPLPGTETLVARAKEILTQTPKIDVGGDAIALVAIEARQWRDSSLGCPREGMMYSQVITPGYLLVLQAGGKQFEFHTNTGEAVVLCLIDGEDAVEVLSEG
jgi:hypothetical protein